MMIFKILMPLTMLWRCFGGNHWCGLIRVTMTMWSSKRLVMWSWKKLKILAGHTPYHYLLTLLLLLPILSLCHTRIIDVLTCQTIRYECNLTFPYPTNMIAGPPFSPPTVVGIACPFGEASWSFPAQPVICASDVVVAVLFDFLPGVLFKWFACLNLL